MRLFGEPLREGEKAKAKARVRWKSPGGNKPLTQGSGCELQLATFAARRVTFESDQAPVCLILNGAMRLVEHKAEGRRQKVEGRSRMAAGWRKFHLNTIKWLTQPATC